MGNAGAAAPTTVVVNDGHGLSVVASAHHGGPEGAAVDGVGPAVAQLLQTGSGGTF